VFIFSHFFAPIYVKIGATGRHVGALGRAKFHINRGGYAPELEHFHFLVALSYTGDSLDRFLKVLGAFMRSTTLQTCLIFDVIRLTSQIT